MQTHVVNRGDRLVMYRESADTPAYWEAHWRENRCYRMRRYEILPWYRALFREYLPRRGVVLEAGCGNGNTLRTVWNEGYEIVGLDFAPEVIEANRAIHPEGVYVVGDVRALPYEEGALSGYISLGVIEHFSDEDRMQILREARRALAPGGVACISVPWFSPVRRVRAALGGYARAGSEVPAGLAFYQYFFRTEEFVSDLRGAGFEVLRLDGYCTQKGIVDTVTTAEGAGALEAAAEHPRFGRWIDHPPRAVRALAAHMVIAVCVKGAPAVVAGRRRGAGSMAEARGVAVAAG